MCVAVIFKAVAFFEVLARPTGLDHFKIADTVLVTLPSYLALNILTSPLILPGPFSKGASFVLTIKKTFPSKLMYQSQRYTGFHSHCGFFLFILINIPAWRPFILPLSLCSWHIGKIKNTGLRHPKNICVIFHTINTTWRPGSSWVPKFLVFLKSEASNTSGCFHSFLIATYYNKVF